MTDTPNQTNKMKEPSYTYRSGKWEYRDGETRRVYPRIGIIFRIEDGWDRLLRHGCLEHMRDLFFGPAFDEVPGAVIVEITPDQSRLLSLALSDSPSRACSRIASGERDARACKSRYVERRMVGGRERKETALQVAKVC